MAMCPSDCKKGQRRTIFKIAPASRLALAKAKKYINFDNC
jgi:hypothetical protein